MTYFHTEEPAGALKELAAREGVSMAELIRQAVERLVEERSEEEKWRRASALIGRYHDEATDVAVNHDRYLDVAYADGGCIP